MAGSALKLLLAAMPVTVALLTACGAQPGSDSAPSGTPSRSAELEQVDPDEFLQNLPECDDVWVVGNTVSFDYNGCLDARGDPVLPNRPFDCGSERYGVHLAGSDLSAVLDEQVERVAHPQDVCQGSMLMLSWTHLSNQVHRAS